MTMTNGSTESRQTIDEICINTIRTLSMDAIEAANSGHPGAPMGLAPAGYVLWTKVLTHNPRNPLWADRDRFILSGGHASMLLYSLLHLTGYDVSLEDIKNFRQWGSKTPGHPEYLHTPGVETTTGPLGQGIANAVGLAMAERHMAAVFNRPDHDIIDHFTYVICGDGDLMEGVASEAASLAGHLGLGKLICLYDDNRISIEGSTDITFTEDVAMRFRSYGWHTLVVEDGNNTQAIQEALLSAKAEADRPTLILLRTHIAYGSPGKQDSADAHGAPLGEEEVRSTKRNLNWPQDKHFHVPEEAVTPRSECVAAGAEGEAEWNSRYEAYKKAYPEDGARLSDALEGRLPLGWDDGIPDFSDSDPIATRAASGQILNAIADRLADLIGGSADLAPSNKTVIASSNDYQKEDYSGRNIRFGVREHAMAAILSGLALHKGLRPYGGTFLVFADYMRPSIRLAALMRLPVIYVFTHDSVAVGEDGPTHQPVEHLAALRLIPGLTVIRPADGIETADAWRQAIEATDGPVALILSRQKLPNIAIPDSPKASTLSAGAYILADTKGPSDIILMASGSEVHVILEAKELLADKGVKARVISFPSWELFDAYGNRDQILPSGIPCRLAVEAGHPMGWEKYVGDRGKIIGIDTYGASAPGATVLKNLGFTADHIAETALAMIAQL